MKKTLIALTVAGLGFTATTQAAVEASAVATWQATAKKDTTSELVVTPPPASPSNMPKGSRGSTPSMACLMSPSRGCQRHFLHPEGEEAERYPESPGR